MITWIEKHNRLWRIFLLILLLVAFLGPWGFDRINVPAEFECSAPNIRLEGEFCGLPLTGIWHYGWMVPGLIYASGALLKGELALVEWFRELLFGVILCLPLLPIFSTLLLILRGDQRNRQIFSIFAWILAIGFGLLVGLNNYPRFFWVLWGVWLYIGLAICALILEIIIAVTPNKME